MDAKKLTNAALLTAVAVVITLLGAYIPPLFFLFFLLPVPIAIMILKSSETYAAVGGLVVFVLNIMFTDIITAFIGLLLSIIGFTIGFLIYKRKKATDTIIETSIISVFLLVLTFYMINFFFKINVITEFLKSFDMSLRQVLNLYSNHPNIDAIKNSILSLEQVVKMSLPASFIITIAFIVLVNYILIAKIMKTQGVYIDNIPQFKYWKMPYVTGWIFIIALLYQYFLKRPEIMSTNIIVLLSIGFTFTGMAVIKYYFDNKLKMKNFVSISILIILFIIPLTSWLLTLIGLADASINLRKYMP
ncbi:MAG: DUF2232 domain-containing protein [Thermoanaerobacteraceae bacterium]